MNGSVMWIYNKKKKIYSYIILFIYKKIIHYSSYTYFKGYKKL